MSTRRKAILGALLLVIFATGLGWFLSVKSAKGVSVRFLGYAEGKPYAGLSLITGGKTISAGYIVGGRAVSTDQTMRVAKFAISNGNDFSVRFTLWVPYTNQHGAFVPSNYDLAARTATNVIGVAVPPPTDGTAVNYPSSPDWTKSWRLHASVIETAPLQGIRASREQVTSWLYRHDFNRVGRFINPRKIQQVESELIPPDSATAR